MIAFLKFCFFCGLAVVAGVVAVSIPFAGRTPAEHVRRLVHEATGAVVAAIPSPAAAAPAHRPAAPAPAAAPAPTAPVLARKASRPPADDHTASERAALDELIGKKSR
jgi:hypothetical protein